ncbi:MAG: hypothetical protein PQJ46_12250 [Spirochaetales bacterium]|nr:hypothetical protein [Spirochaetales bacterium]
MAMESLIFIISRLVFGAVAAFLAILLWSKTRDAAWMFIVVGTIFRYGQIMYDTFAIFGIVRDNVIIIPGYLKLDTLLENLPYCFFIIAFSIMLGRTVRRWK